MPLFRLNHQLIFPPPHLAVEEGLLAVGGDLSPERLLLAYSMGIFPWYSDDEPILWWSPDPRLVLLPDELHVPRRLAAKMKRAPFDIRMDTAFEEVIRGCAETPRPDQPGTWITEEMLEAYVRLHELGYAHSVECWRDGILAGGLYGVSLGSCFFGESMFSRVTDASKIALAALVGSANDWGFTMIDCQVSNPHLERLGARDMTRKDFLKMLGEGLKAPDRVGKWVYEGR